MPYGLHKPLKEFTDNELLEKLETADMRSPVSDFVMAELTRRSSEKLNKSIDAFSASSDKYSKKVIWLTVALLVLTIVQVVALFIK